jgi:glycosyltransferase involved in cell wall biosynthesis
MRIGHYKPALGNQGGKSSYVHRVSEAQAEAGHDVYLLDPCPTPAHMEAQTGASLAVLRSADALFEKAADLQLHVLNLHTPVRSLPEAHVPTVRVLHGHTPYCPSGSQHWKRWDRPCSRTYGTLGCLWGHFVDRCGSIRPQNLQRVFQRTKTEQRVLPQITTITVSRFLKQRMVRAGYPRDRIRVVHSPGPAAKGDFQPPPEGPARFAFVGRIVPQKGLAVLLQAMTHVPQEVHLDVAGDGDLAEEMKELARELGLSDRVAFHGWCTEDEVKTLMHRARAAVFPSTWHEPAGLVSLEAAAYGRPVIASRVGGIPEYATDEYALHVPPNDAERLADRITTLARDRERAERMGRAGRRVARSRFAMPDFLERLDAIYEGVISRESPVVSACQSSSLE